MLLQGGDVTTLGPLVARVPATAPGDAEIFVYCPQS
jgi:hypothetical protein